MDDLYFAPCHQRGGWEPLPWVLHERRFLLRDAIQETCPVKGDIFKQTFKMSGATKGPRYSLKLDFLEIPRGLLFSPACYKWKVDIWAKLEPQQCTCKKPVCKNLCVWLERNIHYHQDTVCGDAYWKFFPSPQFTFKSCCHTVCLQKTNKGVASQALVICLCRFMHIQTWMTAHATMH